MKICHIIERVRVKNIEKTILLVDISKAFESIHRGKIKELFREYGRLRETITTIMMLSKIRKQWFSHLRETPNSSKFLHEFYKEIL